MIGKTQCPNCGGYKVKSSIAKETYRSGWSRANDFIDNIPMGMLFIASVLLAAPGAWLLISIAKTCVNVEYCTTTSDIPKLYIGQYLVIGGIILFTIWLLLILIISPLVGWLDDQASNAGAREIGTDYACNLCGYEWRVLFGAKPPTGPTSGANRHLMELGEDLQRRQREATAGALYQQEQERKRQQNR